MTADPYLDSFDKMDLDVGFVRYLSIDIPLIRLIELEKDCDGLLLIYRFKILALFR